MKVEFEARNQLSDRQKNGIQQLRSAVYRPEVVESLPSRLFMWMSPQWSILLWEQDELVSRVGLIVRDVMSQGESKTIGGIGGVMTHPGKQGQGYASQAMREASHIFDEKLNVAFALLFCLPPLVEFYKRFHWKPFQEKIFVEQPSGKIEFSAYNVMVLDVKERAPLSGSLDLNGLPW